MKPAEAIIMANTHRYCTYKGYGHTFRFTGPYRDRLTEQPVQVLAIDAIINIYLQQFLEHKMLRDLNKAYAGFSYPEYADDWISTGMWGCGAFNGDPVLKFLQQMMVAAECNKKMYYSCYLNENLTSQLQQLGELLQNSDIRVKDVWKLCTDFRENHGKFYKYI